MGCKAALPELVFFSLAVIASTVTIGGSSSSLRRLRSLLAGMGVDSSLFFDRRFRAFLSSSSPSSGGFSSWVRAISSCSSALPACSLTGLPNAGLPARGGGGCGVCEVTVNKPLCRLVGFRLPNVEDPPTATLRSMCTTLLGSVGGIRLVATGKLEAESRLRTLDFRFTGVGGLSSDSEGSSSSCIPGTVGGRAIRGPSGMSVSSDGSGGGGRCRALGDWGVRGEGVARGISNEVRR